MIEVDVVPRHLRLLLAWTQIADPFGGTRSGFSAEGTINRKDFGLTWAKVLDSGGAVVGDTVKIRIEIEAIKEEEPG